MKLDWLADEFHDAGLAVIEHTGWKTRTMRPFSDFSPVGLINHHTAGSSVLTNYPNPPYYSNSSLETKCNYTIRGDGTVVVLNAGWAHDSGYGDRKVLAAVTSDVPAPAPTDTYNAAGNPAGLNPGLLMNRWYIDVEVQHLGNGSAIAPLQREALITSNAVVCRHMGWNPATRLIGHRESTTRKIDPRWGGFTNPMPKIRTDTLEDTMLTDDDIRRIWDHKEKQFGDFLGQPDQRVGTLLAQSHANAWEAVQQTDILKTLVKSEDVSDADLDAAVDRLIEVLPPAVIAKLKEAL